MKNEQDYLIAGFRLRAEGDKLTTAMATLQGFKVFATDSREGNEPLIRLVATDEEAPTFGQEMYRSTVDDVTSRFGRYEGGYCFASDYADGRGIRMWNPQDTNVFYLSHDFDPRLLRFTCWIAFGIGIAPYDAVAIHTSVLTYQGKAVLFLGESGTGKSTHTRLWREYISGAALLNDDSPIVRIHDGIPYAYGSPWSGKTPCYKTERYPLAACVRLSQAPYNKMERLNIPRAYAALHPSCPPDFAYDDTLYDHISRVLNVLLGCVPVYHLACLPDEAAARLSCTTIFGQPCAE